MTENKRFNFNLIFGEDEHKGLIFDDGKIMKTTDVVYLLNKLSKEVNNFVKLATENVRLEDMIGKLEEKNVELEELISEQAIQLDYLQAENQHMKEVLEENKQLKQQLNLRG